MFNGNIQIRIRQCPVKKYNEQLLHLAETLRIDPTKVISNAMKLDDATKGYENFDKKEEKMKIVLYLNPENNPTTLVNGCKV